MDKSRFESESSIAQSADGLAGSGRSRRRLLAGSGTAFMLTLAGRPAWGSSCTPSATASANLSGQHDYATCKSKSAGYWKVRGRWTKLSPDANFHSFFGGDRFLNLVEPGLTLIEVINLLGNWTSTAEFPGPETKELSGGPYNNEHQIGLHTVGALVNAHEFPLGSPYGDFGYSVAQVIDVYNMNDALTAAMFFEQINNQFDLT